MKRTGLRNSLAVAAVLLCAAAGAPAQEKAKHPIAFDDMIHLHRVSTPEVSADGKWVAYAVATPDMDANRNASNIWVVSTAGGAPIQLTQSGHDSSPVWSPDGKMLAFLSSRDGNSQVYVLPMDGGEPHAWTKARVPSFHIGIIEASAGLRPKWPSRSISAPSPLPRAIAIVGRCS